MAKRFVDPAELGLRHPEALQALGLERLRADAGGVRHAGCRLCGSKRSPEVGALPGDQQLASLVLLDTAGVMLPPVL